MEDIFNNGFEENLKQDDEMVAVPPVDTEVLPDPPTEVVAGVSKRKIYNAAFITYFLILLSVALLRVVLALGALDFMGDEALDYAFTFISQILILGLPPVLVVWRLFKKDWRSTASFLQIKKPKKYIYFSFLIGLFGFGMSMALSYGSSIVLTMVGYHLPEGDPIEPMSLGMLFLNILFIGVFPAVCEEITHRGLVLNAQKNTGLSDSGLVVVGGILFGLFHMYIGQTFFTAVLGGVLVFVTIKSKSIVPAVIIHFTNNTLSVLFDFLTSHGANPLVNAALEENMLVLLGFLAVIFAAIPVTIVLTLKFGKMAVKAGDADKPFRPQFTPQQFQWDPIQNKWMTTNPQPVPQYQWDAYRNMWVISNWQPVPAYPIKKPDFIPKFRDKIFFIAAVVFASAITLVSFISGL